MISIIIPTKNRPTQIYECLQSILRNNTQQYEIIVINQSTTGESFNRLKQIHDPRVHYVRCEIGGKSAALNRGMSIAKSDIYAFTDDDCIVSKQWLSTIQKSFTDNPNISVVFGKTLPYQPHLHKNQICPCTFTNTRQTIITKPCLHYKHIGFGNNMAIRKSALQKLGGFKNWLGPGSIGSNAEDAEFALRTLLKGHKILYDPSITIYHNKWLTPQEMKTQHLSYACGETACYGYFYFQGHIFAKPIVWSNIRDSYYKIKNILKNILLLRWNKALINTISYTCVEIFYRGKGLLVGFVYSLTDPIL